MHFVTKNFTSPAAVAKSDFTFNKSFVDFSEGQTSGELKIDILDDTIPEVNEYFTISLTKVELLSSGAKQFPPRLGNIPLY